MHGGGNIRLKIGVRPVDTLQRRLDIQRILRGLDQQEVDTPGNQAASLHTKVLNEFIKRDVGRDGNRASCRTNGTCDEAGMVVRGGGVCRSTRDLRADTANLFCPLRNAKFAQHERG